MSSSPSKMDEIVLSLISGNKVLDLGCGYGRWGVLLFTNYWESGLTTPPKVDGIDAFEPNVKFCKKLGVYNSVKKVVLPHKIEGDYDVVIASDIIEHIEPKKVNAFFKVIESAGNRVIITTPNFKCLREGSSTALGYNAYEAHKSYVSRKHLKKRGYKIIGVGLGNLPDFITKILANKSMLANKSVRGRRKQEKFISRGNTKLFKIQYKLESVARIFPVFANQIVAYKDIK